MADQITVTDNLTVFAATLDRQADTLRELFLGAITRQQGVLEEWLSRNPKSSSARSAHRPWYPGGKQLHGRRIAELWQVKTEGQVNADGQFFPLMRITNPHIGARPWLFGRPAVQNVRPRYPNPELPLVQWHDRKGRPIRRYLPAGRIPWRMALTTRYGYAARPAKTDTFGKMLFLPSYDLPAIPPNEKAAAEIEQVVGTMGKSATATLVKDGLVAALRSAMTAARGGVEP